MHSSNASRQLPSALSTEPLGMALHRELKSPVEGVEVGVLRSPQRRFGITAEVLAKCKLKYYRISSERLVTI